MSYKYPGISNNIIRESSNSDQNTFISCIHPDIHSTGDSIHGMAECVISRAGYDSVGWGNLDASANSYSFMIDKGYSDIIMEKRKVLKIVCNN